eukprot:COSAG06_NODE_1299_length_9946_cov_11.715345_4_plen_659_part_01
MMRAREAPMRQLVALAAAVAAVAALLPTGRLVSAQESGWAASAGTPKLLASDAAARDFFGEAVSVSGTVIAVGAYKEDDAGRDAGAVYVYEQQLDETWLQTAKIIASDGRFTDYFGASVSVSGSVIVVGAYKDDDGGTSSGSAYVFEQQADGTWLQTTKIVASDASSGDMFGGAVSISGSVILVGAEHDDDAGTSSGSAYVFEQHADGTWLEVTKLAASDAAPGDTFGASVSVSGTVLAVGANKHNSGGRADAGAVYIFEKQTDGTWTESSKAEASDGLTDDWFGYSVSVSGNVMVGGAWRHTTADSGAAYVFKKSDDTWAEVAKLEPADGAQAAFFGYSVSVSGTVVVAGAYKGDINGADSGQAYVFEEQDGGAWLGTTVTAFDGASGDYFGWSIAVSGQVMVAGANKDDDGGTSSGSAYVIECPTCVSCATFADVPSVAEGSCRECTGTGPADCVEAVCNIGYGNYSAGACTQCASLADEPSVSSCQACTGPEPADCIWGQCTPGYGGYFGGSCTAYTCQTPNPLPSGYIVNEGSLYGPEFDVNTTCAPGFAGANPLAICQNGGAYMLAGCQFCDAGQYAGVGAPACAFCESGRADDDFDAATPCSDCAVGTYAGCGETSCQECAPGQVDSDENSATPCTTCLVGQYWVAATTSSIS